ncbi:hypothetical protein PVPAM_040038000 [Plasmodium vivax]|nr:hypothetical protein PVPAM_040038000 [Plasmodium vivax]
MEETEVDKMVLTYDKYMDFKKKFRPKVTSTSGTEKLDEILYKANIEGETKKNYLDAFILLLEHIQNDHVFFDGNDLDACKYINYILYKKVEHNMFRSYDENLSTHIKNFLIAYEKTYPGKTNRCTYNIYNIKTDTYNKINPLYELYDKYKECIDYIDANVQYVCKKFEHFLDSYDSYILSTVSKSLKFNEILQNIEEHAKAAFLKYRKGCNDYTNDPLSPKLFKYVPVKEPEIHNKEQMRENRLQSVDSTSHHATHRITNTQETQLHEDISTLQPQKEIPITVERHNVHDNHSANDRHQSISHQQTIDPSIRSYDERTELLPKFPDPFGYSYSSGTKLYSGHDGHVREQAFSKDVELPPLSVMSTITSALKDVDPVPVVGVSGGMGVLFLLFRYTPVGTFFRGRGYRQRIPTRFDGAYPGFFQGFEGFEEGHFPNNHINIAYGPE